MTQDHPITPPPELVQQWVHSTEANDCIGALPTNFEQRICTAAARWGADQELEACCLYMERNFDDWDNRFSVELRRHRRPKPPSLKEQALDALELFSLFMPEDKRKEADAIRRALEQLDD